MRSTKCAELRTWEDVFPARGARMLTISWLGDESENRWPSLLDEGEPLLCVPWANRGSVGVLNGRASGIDVACCQCSLSLLVSSKHWRPWSRFGWWDPSSASHRRHPSVGLPSSGCSQAGP